MTLNILPFGRYTENDYSCLTYLLFYCECMKYVWLPVEVNHEQWGLKCIFCSFVCGNKSTSMNMNDEMVLRFVEFEMAHLKW